MEWDKLFISGNSNSNKATETTTEVQNEFLKLLECETANVFGPYGTYPSVSLKNVLFIFAGAFNNEENISLDRLREIGVKTEFLGRVGLIFNTQPLNLESLYTILENAPLLTNYLNLFDDISKDEVEVCLKEHLKANFDMNSLGARMINTLVHQYFIKGGVISSPSAKAVTFQKKLSL